MQRFLLQPVGEKQLLTYQSFKGRAFQGEPGEDILSPRSRGWTTVSGDLLLVSQVEASWPHRQMEQTKYINLSWLLLSSHYLHAVSVTPLQDVKLHKPHKPKSLYAPVFCSIWAAWQMFIIAPLISLCLGEGDIISTCMAADQSLALWQDISRLYVFEDQRADSSNLSKETQQHSASADSSQRKSRRRYISWERVIPAGDDAMFYAMSPRPHSVLTKSQWVSKSNICTEILFLGNLPHFRNTLINFE